MSIKERPIIFDAESVRAILEGRKTQTRRVVKPEPPCNSRYEISESRAFALCLFDAPHLPGGMGFCPPTPRSKDHRLPNPYGVPGEKLWVREHHWRNGYLSRWRGTEPGKPYWITNHPLLGHERTTRDLFVRFNDPEDPHHWAKQSPFFLPHWASRITLEITEVRVERLQAHAYSPNTFGNYVTEGYPHNTGSEVEVTEWFSATWDLINGKRFPWVSNPWVWVITFRRLEPNA